MVALWFTDTDATELEATQSGDSSAGQAVPVSGSQAAESCSETRRYSLSRPGTEAGVVHSRVTLSAETWETKRKLGAEGTEKRHRVSRPLMVQSG